MNNHKEKDGEIRKHNLPFSKRKEGTEEKLKCTNRKNPYQTLQYKHFPNNKKLKKGIWKKEKKETSSMRERLSWRQLLIHVKISFLPTK